MKKESYIYVQNLVDSTNEFYDEENFGGRFLSDDEKTLYINVFEGNNMRLPSIPNVVYQKVKYSWYDLFEMQKQLRPFIEEFKIALLSKDSSKNKLRIELVHPTESIVKTIYEIIKDPDAYYIVECDAFMRIYDDLSSSDTNAKTQSTTSSPFFMKDGAKIEANGKNLSVTCGVQKTDGSFGVLTSTHILNLWQAPFYYVEGGARNYIGRVTQISNTSDWDFSYISVENPDAHMYGASLDGTQCAGYVRTARNGDPIWINGCASFSSSGMILDNSTDAPFEYPDGRIITMTDIVETNAIATHKDSGGPAFVKASGGLNGLWGYIIGGDTTRCFCGKIYKVMDHIGANLYKF